MQQWSGEAIILSLFKYSEHTGIVRLFSRDKGIFSGAARGALSRKNRAIYEAGNLVQAQHSARLAEHLGSLKCELSKPMAAFFMADAAKLYALQSVLWLVEKSFAEHDPHPQLYDALLNLLDSLKYSKQWEVNYLHFELSLLSEAGFRLELDQCAATGSTENLIYVSPKSGRAVSAEAGAAYKNKLLPLPAFFRASNAPDAEFALQDHASLLDGARLTGYFLQSRLCEPHQLSLPAYRERLLGEWIKQTRKE